MREYMKTDPTLKPRYIKLLVFVVGFIGVIVVGGFFYIQNQIKHFDAVEKEINEINRFLAEAENEQKQYDNRVLNGSKPILIKDVDQAQNDMIQKMKRYELKISEITLMSKANTTSPKGAPIIPGIEYQVIMIGNWDKSMQYLKEMQNGPVLVNIRGIQMEQVPKTNTIRTTMKYKIYTEIGGAGT